MVDIGRTYTGAWIEMQIMKMSKSDTQHVKLVYILNDLPETELKT